MNDPSVGEIGGIFAGFVGMLVAAGHGLKWWLGWTDRRVARRAAKLDAWQKELSARERAFDQRQVEHWGNIQAELAELRSKDELRASELAALRIEHRALRTAHQLISSALRKVDSDNPALGQAEEILKAAFPPEALTPPDMSGLLDQID